MYRSVLSADGASQAFDTWHIKLTVTNELNQAYFVNRELSRDRGLDVASRLGSQIHHHRAVLHGLHHLLGDEHRSLTT